MTPNIPSKADPEAEPSSLKALIKQACVGRIPWNRNHLRCRASIASLIVSQFCDKIMVDFNLTFAALSAKHPGRFAMPRKSNLSHKVSVSNASRRVLLAVASILLLFLLEIDASNAGITVSYGNNTLHTNSVSNGSIAVTLMPDPLQNNSQVFSTSPSSAFMEALDPSNDLGQPGGIVNWGAGTNQPITVNYNSNALNGTLTVDAYNAAISGPASGGGQLNAHFNLAAGSMLPAGTNLAWVQLVTTTVPANPPGSSPYLDVYASSYTMANGYSLFLPFYYRPDETTLDNAAGLETAGNMNIRNGSYTINNIVDNYDIAFDDYSQRTYTGQTIDWTGDLFLAEWTGPLTTPPAGGYGATTLTIISGIQWGWEITAAPAPIIGHGLSGVFALAGLLLGAMLWDRDKKRRFAQAAADGQA